MTDIRPVDPHDDPAFRSWYDAWHAGAVAGRTAPLVTSFEALATSLRNPTTKLRRLPFAAYEGETVVGALLLELSGTSPEAEWTITVPPRHRRRGIGTELFRYGYSIVESGGYTTQFSEIDVPSGVIPEQAPGSAFALALGFSSQHQEDHLVLELPVPAERIAGLRAGATERHCDYEFISWQGACPDEHVEAYARMRTIMAQEVPMGDSSRSRQTWDVEKIRTGEQRLAAQGMRILVTAARHRGGEFAGYSLMFVPQHSPGELYQDDTLVMEKHRGHRLGAELKLRNLAMVAESHPDRRRVHTWTAGSNDAIQAINSAFGFTTVEQTHEYERVDAEDSDHPFCPFC